MENESSRSSDRQSLPQSADSTFHYSAILFSFLPSPRSGWTDSRGEMSLGTKRKYVVNGPKMVEEDPALSERLLIQPGYRLAQPDLTLSSTVLLFPV